MRLLYTILTSQLSTLPMQKNRYQRSKKPQRKHPVVETCWVLPENWSITSCLQGDWFHTCRKVSSHPTIPEARKGCWEQCCSRGSCFGLQQVASGKHWITHSPAYPKAQLCSWRFPEISFLLLHTSLIPTLHGEELTEQEQELHLHSCAPFIMIWTSWSHTAPYLLYNPRDRPSSALPPHQSLSGS